MPGVRHYVLFHVKRCFSLYQARSNSVKTNCDAIVINEKSYERDDYTNVTPKILSFVGQNIHNKPFHPLCLAKQRIINYFYSTFVGNTGNPIFSVYDNISPVVTVEENFDSLMVPEDHISRSKNDCYYINKCYMLRAHTTAHQAELITMGLDNFIIFGDVYRRDTSDKMHFPVFHQVDAVFTMNENQMKSIVGQEIQLFENEKCETPVKQACYTFEATKHVEIHLKNTLISLIKYIYGEGTECRWVDAYFPFTHPSWELEIMFNDQWTEVLGCGITRQEILSKAGAKDRIGWAFGIGLERLAMYLYSIDDIRQFWSTDRRFMSQFYGAKPETKIVFKPISKHPVCTMDASFWVPEGFSSKDFYELALNIGGDFVEQIAKVDEYKNENTGRISHCYRISYRHMERTVSKTEISIIHKRITDVASQRLSLELR